jgi:hypothetical protein
MSETLNFTGTIHTEDLECRKWVEKLDAKIDYIKKQILTIQQKINKKD